ncbi:MAG: hypothetical protein KC646_17645 [Candidatus Cloacimonetes bacterium]|nr:hypothetical protein [Candidatus Cloacimonadota bacterium]
MLNLSQKLENCINSTVYEQNSKTLGSQQILNLFFVAFQNMNVKVERKELQLLINDGLVSFTNPVIMDHLYILQGLKVFMDLEKSTTKWVILVEKMHSIYFTNLLLKTSEIAEKQDVSQIKLLKIFQWYEENPDNIPHIALCTTVICKLKDFDIFKNLDVEVYGLFMFALFVVKNTPIPNIDLKGYKNLMGYFNTSSQNSDKLLELVLDLYYSNYPEELELTSEDQDTTLTLPSNKLNVVINESKRQQKKLLVHGFSRQYALAIKSIHQKSIEDLSSLDNTTIYHQNDYILQKRDLVNVVKSLEDKTLLSLLSTLDVSWVFESRIHLTSRLGSGSKNRLPNNFFHSVLCLCGDEIIHFHYLTISYQLGGDNRIYGTEVKLKELLGFKTVKIIENKLESIFKSEVEQKYLYNFLSRLEEETHKWQQKQ